jgi:putative ABC transport system ATP-binding protein
MAQEGNHPVVRLENVVKIYRAPGGGVAVQALRGVSLSIERGEFVAVMGPSGSGKTTLMNILGCLDRPTSGTYWLDGQDISRLGDDELSDVRGRRIGFVFQSFNLISTQTVLQNLETPLFYQDVPPRERRRRALQMAERVGIADRVHHLPHELSGGQQQRVAIARALMNDPAMVLADEPTGNLDSQSGQAIMEMLTELNAAGRTIVVVTHDPDIARYCRRVVQIHDGLITSEGR